jgi:hypothetical protein
MAISPLQQHPLWFILPSAHNTVTCQCTVNASRGDEMVPVSTERCVNWRLGLCIVHIASDSQAQLDQDIGVNNTRDAVALYHSTRA